MTNARGAGAGAGLGLAALVGLELRPRRLREAGALWAAVTEQRGVAGRDALWDHPDLLPTSDDLDEPLDFVARQAVPCRVAAGGGPLTPLLDPERHHRGDKTPAGACPRVRPRPAGAPLGMPLVECGRLIEELVQPVPLQA